MKSITALVWILRIFGGLSIISGLYSLGVAIGAATFILILYFRVIGAILGGIALLFLAQGLSKKEKWAWYTTLVILLFWLLTFIGVLGWIFLAEGLVLGRATLSLFFILPLLVIIVPFFILALLLWLLIKGRKPFLEQPKEKISQWLRKPYFIIVAVGIFIQILISGGVLVWQYFWLPGEAEKGVVLPPDAVQMRPVELEVYKNEKYGFRVEYFTDKLAIERDYEVERLDNNPRLLFDVFFYDSDYGVNEKRTKIVPVVTIEVFECPEEDFSKCYDQVTAGPKRYTMGPMGSSWGTSYFRINSLSTYSLSFSWRPQEQMRGSVVIKDQLLYIILIRTGSEEFKAVPENLFNQTRSAFEFFEPEEIEVDETADWNEMTNTSYSFKFPENWEIKTYRDITYVTPKEKRTPEDIWIWASVVKKEDLTAQPFYNLINFFGKPGMMAPVSVGERTFYMAEESFEGIKDIKYAIASDDGSLIGLITLSIRHGRQRMDYYIPDEEIKPELQTFNQVLSTFRFLE